MAIINNNISRNIENDSSDNLELNSLVTQKESENNSTCIAGASKVVSKGDAPKGNMYAQQNYAEFSEGESFSGLMIASLNQARYNGVATGSNASWASIYGDYTLVDYAAGAEGRLGFMIGNNIVSRNRAADSDVTDIQGIHCTVDLREATVEHAVVCLLDYDSDNTETISGNFSYLFLTDDVPANVGGEARAIDSRSTLKSQFAGALQIGETPTMTETDNNAGSLRYIETANRSAVEMLMKTGASAYSWVVIQENTF